VRLAALTREPREGIAIPVDECCLETTVPGKSPGHDGLRLVERPLEESRRAIDGR